jgi:hypothetical protein
MVQESDGYCWKTGAVTRRDPVDVPLVSLCIDFLDEGPQPFVEAMRKKLQYAGKSVSVVSGALKMLTESASSPDDVIGEARKLFDQWEPVAPRIGKPAAQ